MYASLQRGHKNLGSGRRTEAFQARKGSRRRAQNEDLRAADAPPLSPNTSSGRVTLSSSELTIRPPDDAFELEADRTAQQILATPLAEGPAEKKSEDVLKSRWSRRSGIGSEAVQREVSPSLQTGLPSSVPIAGAQVGVAGGFARSVNVARSQGGESLPGWSRRFMEPRFGHSFEQVRVHRGPKANQLAEEAHASAFTVGQDIFFKDGEFSPNSPRGKRLLAHELTHVVQQRNGLRGAQRVLLQRQEDAGRLNRFAAIHAFSMPALLLALESLRPFGEMDYELARQKFGVRLVIAMRAVSGEISVRDPELRELPQDQVLSIQRYLGFAEMWRAHPHDAQPNAEENQSSTEVRSEHGLPDSFANTCAIRVSVMLNRSGRAITKAKAREAGLSRDPFFSLKTKMFYVLGAAEMMKYLKRHFRAPDKVLPVTGSYRSAEAFNAAFQSTIVPFVQGKKGIVGFETIFGYDGSGHVDLFDGIRLSQSAGWYPCRRLLLWNVLLP